MAAYYRRVYDFAKLIEETDKPLSFLLVGSADEDLLRICFLPVDLEHQQLGGERHA
jgi:hypothetical protein